MEMSAFGNTSKFNPMPYASDPVIVRTAQGMPELQQFHGVEKTEIFPPDKLREGQNGMDNPGHLRTNERWTRRLTIFDTKLHKQSLRAPLCFFENIPEFRFESFKNFPSLTTPSLHFLFWNMFPHVCVRNALLHHRHQAFSGSFDS